MQTEQRKNRISPDELLDLGDYERKRDGIRNRAMAARLLRRVAIGPNATLSFEGRETVLYQIQEILRAERIAKPAEVEFEADNYSDLLPSENELSATLMFEFPDEADRAVRLRDLAGFENHFFLEIDGAGRAVAFFDRRQIDPDRLSAVQFVRFPVTDVQRDAIARGARVAVVSDHPLYPFTSAIGAETRRALAADLAEAADV